MKKSIMLLMEKHYIWSDISDSAMKILNVRAKTLVIPEVLLPFLSSFLRL